MISLGLKRFQEDKKYVGEEQLNGVPFTLFKVRQTRIKSMVLDFIACRPFTYGSLPLGHIVHEGYYLFEEYDIFHCFVQEPDLFFIFRRTVYRLALFD